MSESERLVSLRVSLRSVIANPMKAAPIPIPTAVHISMV
jgi:hypothetical protein